MKTHVWRVWPADLSRATHLARHCGVSAFLGQALLNRGVTDPADAARFFRPSLQFLDDPLQLPQMSEAVARIRTAIRDQQRIWIFGDSDVDGITASASVYETLRALGGHATVKLSNRLQDGYGFPSLLIEQAARAKVALLILVDCGTNQRADIEALRANGIDTVILDHHLPAEQPAQPAALVNAYFGSGIGKELCSVGLAFKLAQALQPDDPALWQSVLDLSALGTLADYAPLRGDSRILLTCAESHLHHTARPGLRQLYEAVGVATPSPDAVLRKIIPVLNAAGRLGNPRPVFELLVTRSEIEATRLLSTVLEHYAQTKSLHRHISAEASAQVDRLHFRDQYVMVVGRQGWHPGLMGPLAAQLAQRYGRPAIAIAFDEHGVGVGSGRSPSMFNLFEALRACDGMLVRYGGHPRACGLTVSGDQFESFRQSINRHIHQAGTYADLAQTLDIDAELTVRDLTAGFAQEATRLAPFGSGNPKASVLLRRVRVNCDEDGGWVVAGRLRRKVRGSTQAQRCSPDELYDVVVTPSVVDGQCAVSLCDVRETSEPS